MALPDTSEVAAFLSEKAEKLTDKATFDMKDNVPFVVFADADIKAAAKAAVAFRFRESAHCPVRVKTLHVHESVAQAFCDEIANEVHQLVAGNPHDYRTAVGVLPNLEAGDYLERGIKDALARGASIVTGGVRCEFRVEPTILIGVATDAVLLREDAFGPVVPIFVFSSNSEVSDLIQTLPCPIAASVWTSDADSIQCVSDITDLSVIRTNEYRDLVPDVLFERLTYHKAPGGRFEWTIPDFFSTTNDVDFGNQQLLQTCID
jgi:succinate-semialdehyde dehydrogenase/glutarate-semialdehyde dehydrogenase